MNNKIQQCKNCNKQFKITSEDQEFCAKISVPEPNLCSDCKTQRRMAFRNERSIYKRNCNLCGKSTVSIYHKDSPYVVYCQKCWWSDKWNPLEYGKEYDFNKPFFEQFKGLWLKFPQLALINENGINSEYCNITIDNKNCYLVFGGDYNEDCNYCVFNFYSKDSADLYWAFKSELCYELVDCDTCYKVFFSRYTDNTLNSSFLYDCRNCQNCFGSINLRNKKYQIFNKQYSKEEYEQKIKKMDLGSFRNLTLAKKKYNDLKLRYPHKYAMISNSYNCKGDNIKNSKNCENVYDAHYNLENVKNLWLAFNGPKDILNACHVSQNSELVYDSCGIVAGSKILFSKELWNNNSNIQYSNFCIGSNNLFGCIGLRKKQYCILNKQYTKEEYEELVPKIIEHMG